MALEKFTNSKSKRFMLLEPLSIPTNSNVQIFAVILAGLLTSELTPFEATEKEIGPVQVPKTQNVSITRNK